jgi:hypothetical protein
VFLRAEDYGACEEGGDQGIRFEAVANRVRKVVR